MNNIILKKITIRAFGLFNFLELELKRSLNIILGRTGSGKTTLLNIIYYIKNPNKILDNMHIVNESDLYRDIEYYFSSEFFGFSDIQEPIVLRVQNNKPTIINNPLINQGFNSNRIFDFINKNLEIIFLNYEKLSDRSIYPYLSLGEVVFENFKKFTSKLKNKLILIDELHGMDMDHLNQVYSMIKQLSKENQVIFTTQRQPKSINSEDIIFILPDISEKYLIDILLTNSNFFINFNNTIKNIKELMEIKMYEDNLKKTLNKLLFLNVIIAMETYLSDAFIFTVSNNMKLIRKFIENSSEFEKQKLKLSELFSWVDKIRDFTSKYLKNFTYHTIWKVEKMYKDVLNVDFPEDLSKIIKAVLIRHDIVHRNGKTKEGKKIDIGEDDIKDIVDEVEKFIKSIDSQLISKGHVKIP